jgi:hypothetical protein
VNGIPQMLRSSNLECVKANLLTLLELDSKIDLDSLCGIDLLSSLRYVNHRYSGIDNSAQFQWDPRALAIYVGHPFPYLVGIKLRIFSHHITCAFTINQERIRGFAIPIIIVVRYHFD